MFALGIAGGIFADQILWPYFIERPLFYKYRLEQAPINVVERQEIFITENTALQNAAEKAIRAIAGIKSVAAGKAIEGTGIAATSDGLIVALNELVPQNGKTDVYIEGTKINFTVVKRDAKNNLILLKTDRTNLATVGFVEPGSLRFGQRVFLAGNIFKNGGNETSFINEGIIKTYDDAAVYTNINENGEALGSPLFNISGELIGLTKIDSNGNVLAIPIKKISDFVGF